jgi:predicted secreted protein
MTLLSLFGSQNGRVSYNRTSLAAILQWLSLFAILFLGVVSCFSAGAKPAAETTEGAGAKTTTETTEGAGTTTSTDMTVTLLGATSWQYPVVALYQSSSSREWKQKRWTRNDTKADKELTSLAVKILNF